MHKIKEKPEDFVVEEITSVKPLEIGSFSYFWLQKKNLNTMQAVEYIAHDLHMNLKYINFAGTKDKVAVTKQLISVKGKAREQIERLHIKDITLTFYGYGNESLHLGDLLGNKFIIRVVDISADEKSKLLKFSKLKEHLVINYFGEQRFSKNNAAIGKFIIKGDIKLALDLILIDSVHSNKIRSHLTVQPNDYVTALKLIPKKMLRMYVNSYQSLLWNEAVKKYVYDFVPKSNLYIPMIGFGMEIENDDVHKIIKEIMKRESISLRDFIIKKLPDLSAEGIPREIFLFVSDFKIVEQKENSAVVSFTLPKGCYATEVIKQIFE